MDMDQKVMKLTEQYQKGLILRNEYHEGLLRVCQEESERIETEAEIEKLEGQF
jgi:hypothetical protein